MEKERLGSSSLRGNVRKGIRDRGDDIAMSFAIKWIQHLE